MVRIIVGTLVEAGPSNGACSPLKRLWKALTGVWRERQRLQGLFLSAVAYEEKNFPKCAIRNGSFALN